jgi:hypothetical protein
MKYTHIHKIIRICKRVLEVETKDVDWIHPDKGVAQRWFIMNTGRSILGP